MLAEDYSVLETHVLPVFTINIWDNGIVHIQVAGDTMVELQDIERQYEFLKNRFNSTDKFIILVESGENSSLTKEAREFSSLPETNAFTHGTAVIVKTLAERLIINFMINVLHQQTMKLRMFDDKKKAINWLLSLKTN